MCAVVCSTLGMPLQEQDSVIEAVCSRSVERCEQDEAEPSVPGVSLLIPLLARQSDTTTTSQDERLCSARAR